MTNRVVNWQRTGPGAGRARTWHVSSTVGVQATGRWVLKMVGGNASRAQSSATVSTGFTVGELEPATDPGDATPSAVSEPHVVGVEMQFDLAHERGREDLRGDDVHAPVDRWKVGRRAVDEEGTMDLAEIAEGAQHGQQRTVGGVAASPAPW